MNTQKLRIAIAIAKGFAWYEVGNHAYLVSSSGLGLLPKGIVKIDQPHEDNVIHLRCPNYANNIEDAWDLAEEMTSTGIEVKISLDNGFYRVDFHQNKDSKMEISVGDFTAPLAISRAWWCWYKETHP